MRSVRSDASRRQIVAGGRVNGRILLVEDDASIREVVALGLRAIGFDVVTAPDGPTGLERWRADEPELVLLDVMLPGLDGLEICRAIRRESTVPIVMLTARGDTVDVVVGLEAGADDYVRKPFEMAELVARVRAALRRRERVDASLPGAAGVAGALQLGPLEIDVAGRSVVREGREILLTRTEFDLLVELASRPGIVLTREVLLDHVWGYDFLGDSRLVDVAVGRLRAKVEADPAHPQLLLTVRGSGYKAARPS
jgi:two-component system response regulator MtrA